VDNTVWYRRARITSYGPGAAALTSETLRSNLTHLTRDIPEWENKLAIIVLEHRDGRAKQQIINVRN
jgi:hypothetical protein